MANLARDDSQVGQGIGLKNRQYQFDSDSSHSVCEGSPTAEALVLGTNYVWVRIPPFVLGDSVTVAPEVLVLFVWVRILISEFIPMFYTLDCKSSDINLCSGLSGGSIPPSGILKTKG